MDSLDLSVVGQQYPLDSLLISTWGYTSSVPPIQAVFSVDKSADVAPLLVHFTDHSTGSIDTYSWDYGDGSSIDHTAGNVQHTYPTIGKYVATLTVQSGSTTSVASITIYATSVVPAEIIESSIQCKEDISPAVKF